MAPWFLGYRGLLARIDTTLFKFGKHDDQAGPGKQAFKRLGHVVRWFKQLKGVVVSDAKHTGHKMLHILRTPATRCFVLPLQPCSLDIGSRNTYGATEMLMSRS